MSPIILVGAGLLIFGLGLGIGYWFSRQREATKAGDIQNELDQYREQVTEHFSETAQHFQALGQQYQSLYKHMATGAGALCDPAKAEGMLEFAAADTAVLTAGADEQEETPEPIRDYAPDEPGDAAAAQPEAEAPEITEAPAEATATGDTLAEQAADDDVADALSQSVPDDTERTVH